MKGLIIKDFLNLRSTLKTLLIMLVVFSIIFIPQGGFEILGIIILMSGMMIITTMSYDDLANWDVYALSMPLTRKELVLSKYSGMVILNLGGGLLALLIGSAGSIFGNIEISWLELLSSIGILLVISLVFGSLMIPMVYKFGTEKARLMIILFGVLPMGLLFLLSQMNLKLPVMSETMGFIMGGASLFGGIVFVVISYGISLKIYKGIEF
ncbi:MAG: ABC-2 transporter permease [Eubacteriaceae bacterium]